MDRINCLGDIFPKVMHSVCNLEALLQDLGLTYIVQRISKHKMRSMKTTANLKTQQLWNYN